MSSTVKPSPDGAWRIYMVDGMDIPADTELRLDFYEDRLAAKGPCNTMLYRTMINGSSLSLLVDVPGRNVCPPSVMQAEAAYKRVLQTVTEFLIIDGELILNSLGKTVMRARAMPA